LRQCCSRIPPSICFNRTWKNVNRYRLSSRKRPCRPRQYTQKYAYNTSDKRYAKPMILVACNARIHYPNCVCFVCTQFAYNYLTKRTHKRRKNGSKKPLFRLLIHTFWAEIVFISPACERPQFPCPKALQRYRVRLSIPPEVHVLHQ
jgi:hypothetical protein